MSTLSGHLIDCRRASHSPESQGAPGVWRKGQGTQFRAGGAPPLPPSPRRPRSCTFSAAGLEPRPRTPRLAITRCGQHLPPPDSALGSLRSRCLQKPPVEAMGFSHTRPCILLSSRAARLSISPGAGRRTQRTPWPFASCWLEALSVHLTEN